jgi:PAS domain S-box-containing protein
MAQVKTKVMESFQEVSELESLLGAEVAERKALEKKLRLWEGYFDALLRAAPAGFAIIDGGLRYIKISESLARINGLPVKEHLGRTIREVLPDLAPKVEPALRRTLASGEPALNLEVAAEVPCEPGVEHRWLNSFIPLPGLDGRPAGVGALVLDVTDCKRREDALAENESKYRMLVEHASDAVLVFDRGGAIAEANPRAVDMFGYAEHELLRLNVRDLVASEELESSAIQLTDLLAGKTVRAERRLRRKDGALLRAEITGSMVGPDTMMALIKSAPERGGPSGIDARAEQALAGSDDKVFSSIKARLLSDISTALATAAEAMGRAYVSKSFPDPESGGRIDLYGEVGRFEAGLIRRALKQAGGKQKEAARLLGVKQTTLHAMIKRHKIDLRDLGDKAA